jgi:acyl transferase domain-containing protein
VSAPVRKDTTRPAVVPESAIAVIGMAGRFPGARNLGEFWANLRAGVESLTALNDEDLVAAGVPAQLLADPRYVKAGSYLEAAGDFDAAFFGMNPREAEATDPQHRIFLECAWEALEDAGYAGEQGSNSIGVFAGASMNTYMLANLLPNGEVAKSVGAYQVMIGNDKDFLATRVSYKLNLKGPSLTVQTACSTSLVAIHVACRNLLGGDCSMALAGGVSLTFPQRTGYLYQEGMIASPDGKCRPFDAKGAGIRAGEGAGIVVLKRLADALRDGDNVRAVILGTAINNDGAQKVGYTAPSVEGQAAAIGAAQAAGGVDPVTISYVEAHGTATPLGDPIEIAALTRAFGSTAGARQFCAIGSLKSNIGHLDAAAGVAGFIKTVLSLEHREIPPSLNFETPNPQIDFQASPFFVNSVLRAWESAHAPRRAGVSSFGIGGTNAHAVLEEAPAGAADARSAGLQLFVLSARTPAALDASRRRLAAHLAANPQLHAADVAFTLQRGRQAFDHRLAFVADDLSAARERLVSDSPRVLVRRGEITRRAVTFMFSGQGSQYAGMGWPLYRDEPVFRTAFDTCAEALKAPLGLDLRTVCFPELAAGSCADSARLNETWLAQPALFAIEYALAQLWMHRGVQPQAMIGHSIGEYVAACLAGVFTLESALAIVATRGRIMQSQQPGAMLAVPLEEADAASYVTEGVVLAAINAPRLCVIAGPIPKIEALERELEAGGVSGRRIKTSHAFHSPLMEPAMAPFAAEVERHALARPRIAFVSNVTGTWIRDEEATDPRYWARHLRHAVRFADGLRTLGREPGRLFIEVGPGNTLKTFVRQTLPGAGDDVALTSVPHPNERQPANELFMESVARAWLAGVPVRWEAFHEAHRVRRVSLPTYPFETRGFMPLPARGAIEALAQAAPARNHDVADWFWLPSWQRGPSVSDLGATNDVNGRWLVFSDESAASVALIAQLRGRGIEVIVVRTGDAFASGPNEYRIRPDLRRDYDELMLAVLAKGKSLTCVLHLWNATATDHLPIDVDRGRRLGFYSLLYLAQALGDSPQETSLPVLVVSTDMHSVLGSESLRVERSLLTGPVLVMSQDVPLLRARSVDLASADLDAHHAESICSALIAEAQADLTGTMVAYRGNYRWTFGTSAVRVRPPAERAVLLRERGVYLITGGLGGIGLAIASHLASTCRARLVLVSRSTLDGTDEGARRRVAAVRELESLGAEVLVATADVADYARMDQALADARKRFGKIDGVFHAAGEPGVGILQLKTVEKTESVLRPKVEGTLLIDRLFADAKLDFLVLCSTINTAFGWHGTTDYSSANAFLDAFAQSGVARCSARVLTINWGTWRDVGMAARFAAGHPAAEEALLGAIKPAEGVEAMRRALAGPLKQVFVTPTPMPYLIAGAAELAARAQAPQIAAPAEASAAAHARPQLESELVAPRTEGEVELAGIWSELLGIEPIGVHDNFFDLGGHSLLATRVLARVHDVFHVKLPMRAIFDAPTIATLVEAIQTAATAGAAPVGFADDEAREELEL